jgi:glycerate-2-kinase
LRKDAREIFRSALRCCDPADRIGSLLSRRGSILRGPGFRFDLRLVNRVIVLGLGKAAVAMSRGLARRLEDRISSGVIAAPPGSAGIPPGCVLRIGSHPVPDAGSFRAGRELLAAAARAGEGDLVVHLISGGGSALATAPLPGILDAAGKRRLHRMLLATSLGIREINAVRKHFSAIKGGRLLRMSGRAHHLSLIRSDVPEGSPDTVAGGPTLPDPTTAAESLAILRETGILPELPSALRRRLSRAGIPETPKPADFRSARHRWIVAASGEDLVRAAALRARELGYETRILGRSVEEPPGIALDRIFAARDALRRSAAGRAATRIAIVAGGEARPPLRARKGRGGRAQDLATAAAIRIQERRGSVFLAAGSDGVDGNSPAAGALADGSTIGRAARAGLDPAALRRRGDTHRLFRTLGDAVVTGPTGNNLRDLYLLLEAEPGERGLTGMTGGRRRSSRTGRC